MIENPIYGGTYAYGKTAVVAGYDGAGVKVKIRRKARSDWLALDGPWIFSRAVLSTAPAHAITDRARQNPRHPAGAAVLPGKLDNFGGETLLVVTTARDLASDAARAPHRCDARRHAAALGPAQAGTATRRA